jgi:outer membrane murein-binding lipoprotein Lpp
LARRHGPARNNARFYIAADPGSALCKEKTHMSWLKNHGTAVRMAAVVVMAGLATTGCASHDFVNKQIATVNSRIDALDSRVTTVSQKADTAEADAQKGIAAAASANSAAQSANSAAQGAATNATQANQRIDQLTGRVDALENPPSKKKKPRG